MKKIEKIEMKTEYYERKYWRQPYLRWYRRWKLYQWRRIGYKAWAAEFDRKIEENHRATKNFDANPQNAITHKKGLLFQHRIRIREGEGKFLWQRTISDSYIGKNLLRS